MTEHDIQMKLSDELFDKFSEAIDEFPGVTCGAVTAAALTVLKEVLEELGPENRRRALEEMHRAIDRAFELAELQEAAQGMVH